MRVPLHIVKARRDRLAALVAQHGFLPVQELCRQLDVSEATARRDLSALQEEKKIKRTYGGAISEFDSRFPSFTERRETAHLVKVKIATTALSFLTPGGTFFFDNGTTIYALAEALSAQPVVPLTIVTSSIPVAEILAGVSGIDVFLVSGQLLPRQSVLIGEMAIRSLGFWHFDLAFLSAEGMTEAGIWNTQPAVVEQQKAVLRRSRRSIFCIDGSKLNQKTSHFLMPWTNVDLLLTDLSQKKMESAGVALKGNQYCHATGKGRGDRHDSTAKNHAHGGLPIHSL